jgi:hypothetical protein
LILHARPTFARRHCMMIILMYTRRYLHRLQDKSGDLWAYNFQVFTALMSQILSFWVVTSCIFCRLFNDGGAVIDLDGRGLIPGGGKRFLFSPQLTDRIWGPPSLLSNGYRELFPPG